MVILNTIGIIVGINIVPIYYSLFPVVYCFLGFAYSTAQRPSPMRTTI